MSQRKRSRPDEEVKVPKLSLEESKSAARAENQRRASEKIESLKQQAAAKARSSSNGTPTPSKPSLRNSKAKPSVDVDVVPSSEKSKAHKAISPAAFSRKAETDVTDDVEMAEELQEPSSLVTKAKSLASASSSSMSKPSKRPSQATAKRNKSTAPPPGHAFNSFVLDCDGVVWHGDDPILGSIEACNLLLRNGCKLHFVTNSSASSRKMVAAKLRRLGVHGITESNVTTSGSAAANLIKAKFPLTKAVFAVGESGLVEELREKGLQVETCPDQQNRVLDSSDFLQLPLRQDVSVVVCGLDRAFNYAKLAVASLYLQAGCPLVSTNLDAYDVLPPKGNVPGSACINAALIASCPDADQFVAGKPSGELLIDIMERHGMDKTRTVMVGDRVDTDIEFAHNAGIASCLVMTGVSSAEHREKATFCEESLATFIKECFPN